MADDKEIKYIMRYKHTNNSEKAKTHSCYLVKAAYFDSATKQHNLQQIYLNKLLKNKINCKNVTMFVHKKNTLPAKYNSIESIHHFETSKEVVKCYSTSIYNSTFLVSHKKSHQRQYKSTKSFHNIPELTNFNFSKWDVYRCQLNTQEESCCCSCNSDAMFEVMKSLYDCYKKKNCDHCNCILCGHLPREERRLGELRKSGDLAAVKVKDKGKKKKKIKSKEIIAAKEGKTPEEKEAALRKMIMSGAALPEPKTQSEKELITKVRTQLALPPEPQTKSEKDLYRKAEAEGLITPLEGKTKTQKMKILQKQMDLGLSLPEGRTPSEKALIQKIRSAAVISTKVPSEKIRKAKKEGLLTPLEGKTPEQKEIILKGLAMNGIPLPKGKSSSERHLIDKVRADLGLPPEPKTSADKNNYKKALAAGLITPLEGKSHPQKEDLLRKQAAMGLSLPKGRTASEKSLIAKIQQTARHPSEFKVPSEKMKKAKDAGLLTPLEGKTSKQKENIIRGLAMHGIPLPEGKTSSERKLIDKIRADLGLPPQPKSDSEKKKYKKALAAGLITPLEGKSQPQKEEILRKQAAIGLSLPQGRTKSEKSIIAKIQQTTQLPSELKVPSEKMKKVKAAGLLTPLAGKTTKQKEDILKGLAMNGIPLPEGESDSDRKIIDKVRIDLGLPPEPTTATEKNNYKKALAAGLITPLEGKSLPQKEELLKKQAAIGLSLPQGRTPSEKSLIAKIQQTARPPSEFKVPSEKMKKAKAAGLLTPLAGKTTKQKEDILKGLAMNGIPLPEGKSDSDRKIIDKVRIDLGLPPEPTTASEKNNYKKALAAGLITPLEGKSLPQKEELLKKQAAIGLSLPQGRTPSEKSLIAKIQQTARPPSEFKVPSEKMKKAKAAGLLTPLAGKTTKQKEDILKGLAMNGIPLPEGKSDSDRKIIDKVRADLGIPPEPKTASEKNNYKKALAAGLITPLEGKSLPQKEELLKKQAAIGLSLPQGRTPSEKSLIAKIQQTARPPSEFKVPSEKMKKAKAAGLLTPLEGKTTKQKEDILKGLAMNGIPLPEGKSDSDRKIIDKVRIDLGLPPEPTTASEKNNYKKALAAGLITPLEGKSLPQKEELLKKQAAIGLSLPQGRTPSEKSLIAKIQQTAPPPLEELDHLSKRLPALTEREKALKDLVLQGQPLPEAKSASEEKVFNKVRHDLGLPPEPKSKADKEKYNQALAAGIILPLEGKSRQQKEKILQAQADMGLKLPEGRTASEKAIIKQIKSGKRKRAKSLPSAEIEKLDSKTAKKMKEGKGPSDECICDILTPESEKISLKPKSRLPSEKLKAAKAAGLLTPLQGKSDTEKEKILKGLAQRGIPLPTAQTASEKKIMDKVRRDLGLPPEPKTPSIRDRYNQAQEAGIITPLEGKPLSQKEKILIKQAEMGLPLPEGRTPSEKDLINRIRTSVPKKVTSEKLRKAKEAGLLTPLEGKSQKEKERILKSLAKEGLPLPEPKTASEKKLIQKVKTELGMPVAAIPSEKLRKAKAAGLLTPLEGKSLREKEKILKTLVKEGLPLPEPKTESEKKLIEKVKTEVGVPVTKITSERLRKAKADGLLTPLEGKSQKDKERILKSLAKEGLPLPEPKTASEKKLIAKVKTELGVPVEGLSSEKLHKAKVAGLITPLEGKTQAQKEKILKGRIAAGLPLPEGNTLSEKDLIKKIKTDAGYVTPTAVKSKSVVTKIPSEKLKAAKAAGLLTPLHGKTDAQKQKILKGLASHGIPLPKAQTTSEKIIIDKVRKELGLPPEPKTPSLREKYRQAHETGFLTPLEGKTAAQKEKILRKQAEIGIPLPEGRTPSEKDLINKVREKIPRSVASDKLRKAKDAGLLSPLQGKSTKDKEKILKGLAKAGLPLPEGKTASEKQLVKKVRADMGIPLEAISSEKLRRAMAEGLITPFQGKSPTQKEKLLRGRAQAGLPLPEGVSSSDKELIKKIKAETGYVTPRVEKLKRVSEAAFSRKEGTLTPAQREKVYKNLVMQGKPLPEAKSASEEKVLNKVRHDLGLPPEPKSKADREKYNQALAAGIILPLEGKSRSQKEKILQAQADMGLALPEGRTASEKAIIKQIKSGKRKRSKSLPPAEIEKLDFRTAKKMKEGKGPSDECICDILTPESEKISFKPRSRLPSEKLKAAKAAGLLTPLQGKSDTEKEKILKGLAQRGIPLPTAQTASEKKIMDKVRKDLGLPPEPRTSSIRGRYNQAQEAGIITPLEGKPLAQKEKILIKQAEMGLPLPEGRTPSEKDLIKRIRTSVPKKVTSEKLRKAKEAGLLTPLEGKSQKEKERILKSLAKEGLPLPEPKTASEKKLIQKVKTELGMPVAAIPSEKLRKAKAAGLLTPLQGKPDNEKERILKSLAKEGLPLPEAKTASEKKIMDKVRRDLGLPPEPKTPSIRDRYNLAQEAGIITPLEGKPLSQKEKILIKQAEMGLPLPEGRTPSEKDLINRIRSSVPKKVTSEKLRKAKEAGLLTPLEGKSQKEKERILKSLAKEGLPLPEPKTASEKKLIQKVKTELGMPVAAIPSEKLRKAKAAGLLTPLQGKPDGEKERIFKGLAQNGIPLPKAQTTSEKKIIDKVRKELGLPPEPKTPSIRDRYDQAQALGIITPLEGKSMTQKEKILAKQAEMGIPLPEGRTQSEKDLINRIRETVPKKIKSEIISETGGISVSASKKEILKKAKTEGLLTPLKGKSTGEKERIIKGLAEAGLPMPEAKTQSEKALIQKVRTSLGLPPETTSIKRDKFKTKSKKVGLDKTKKSEIAVGVGKSKVGITEEFQDIIKTTTCDRGCGCDRKKIRFKHSYVKIRVTSPDISSLCPCPDECVPGVKGGVFTDNEGIKVTVGQVSAMPSYSKEYTSYKSATSVVLKDSTFISSSNQNKIIDSSTSFDLYKDNHKKYLTGNEIRRNKYSKSDTYIFIKSSDCLNESKLNTDIPILIDEINSLFFSSPSNSSILSNTISIISVSVSNCSSHSAYLIERISMDCMKESRRSINGINIGNQEYYEGEIKSIMRSTYSMSSNISFEEELKSNLYAHPNILRLSMHHVNNNFCTKDLKTHQKLNNIIDKILSEPTLKESSSLYVLLPSSSEDNSSLYSYESQLSSTICIQLSEKPLNCNGCYGILNRNLNEKRKNLYHGFKIAAKGRNNSIERKRNTAGSYVWPNKNPQSTLRIKDLQLISKQYEMGTDTTEDRPCCCAVEQTHAKQDPLNNHINMTNVISELVSPFIINDVISQGFSQENYDIIPNKNIYSTKKVCVNQTPVRLCKIPPCSNFSDCHTPKNMNTPLSGQLHPHQIASKQCECDFEKIKELIETMGKEFISTACGISSNINVNPSQENGYVKPIIKKTNFQDTSKSFDCLSCGKPANKEEQKKQCPCERHTSLVNKDLGNVLTSSSQNENYTTNIEQKRNKKNKKKNNKHICECPPAEPEDEFDPILWIDEAQIRKMKSVLTQNTSGFKINRMRKVPEPEMSFEEALSYVIQSDEEKYRRLLCLCDDKNGSKRKKTDCECPSVEHIIAEKVPEEPKGIKLHIGGKGSSSKGLSGVLCFQLLDDN